MERKIGEIFEHNGEWYQCVKGNTCDECSFNKSSWNCLFDGTPYCSDRSDEIEVIFKKLEKVGEPYYSKYYGKFYQKYITYIPAVGYNFKVRIEPVEHVSSTEIYVELKQKEDMEKRN